MTHEILFIPMDQLGLLESMIADLSAIPRKKDRERESRRVMEVLKGTRLIAATSTIKAICLGTKPNGEHGLFVIYSTEKTTTAADQVIVGAK